LFQRKGGVEGALEITKLLKQGFPKEPEKILGDDLRVLARVSLGEDNFDDLKDYEKSLVEKGGYTQLIALDLVSMFPDFLDNNPENTRGFISDLGTFSQIVDDLMDGDHYQSKEDKMELCKKYWCRLKAYAKEEKRFKDFRNAAYLGAAFGGIARLKPYECVRNYFSK
jgi:hypothetical protein